MSKQHHNATWTRLSKQIRLRHPTCQDPFGYHKAKGEVVQSTCVHHIYDVISNPCEIFDSTNLISLCKLCHDALHLKRDAIATIAKQVTWKQCAHAIQTFAPRPQPHVNVVQSNSQAPPQGDRGCFFGGKRLSDQSLPS